MEYLDEYRDPEAAHGLALAIARASTRPWILMEVCGRSTHSIVRHGIDELLPDRIELLHGPGCPLCSTPLETIERAHQIAARPDVTFCAFGDMLCVPGPGGDLLALKAAGSDIRVVHTPLDAVRLATSSPGREVVLFAVGAENAAPASAVALLAARSRGLTNFSVLAAHVLVPPALTALLETPENRVQAFVGPGHVCTVLGHSEYEPIARRHDVPIVVTGFEPMDLLAGVLAAVEQLESGAARVETRYGRAVSPDGNEASRRAVDEVFESCDRTWHGLGALARSGLRLRRELADFDAERRFEAGLVGYGRRVA